jgi:hypothetical protein
MDLLVLTAGYGYGCAADRLNACRALLPATVLSGDPRSRRCSTYGAGKGFSRVRRRATFLRQTCWRRWFKVTGALPELLACLFFGSTIGMSMIAVLPD